MVKKMKEVKANKVPRNSPVVMIEYRPIIREDHNSK